MQFFIIVDIIRNRDDIKRLIKHFAFIFSILFFLYSANCGVNYCRSPFVKPERFQGSVYAAMSSEEKQVLLADFCSFLADRLNDSSAQAAAEREATQAEAGAAGQADAAPAAEVALTIGVNNMHNFCSTFDTYIVYSKG